MDGDTPALSSAAGVAILLAEHWDALDVDFRRHFGLDLEECCFGPNEFGVRRLKAHISRLPPDSATAREMGWSWDEMREMTALLVEVAVNSRRQKDSDPIFKYPRPGALLAAIEDKAPPLTREGIRAAFLGMKGGG